MQCDNGNSNSQISQYLVWSFSDQAHCLRSMCYFDEKHILKHVSTIPEKKNCMLPTFEKSTFCKSLYGENDGPSI